jgi:hypothetical protein
MNPVYIFPPTFFRNTFNTVIHNTPSFPLLALPTRILCTCLLPLPKLFYIWNTLTASSFLNVCSQMLYRYKCYTGTNIIPVQILYRYKCYTGTNVIPVQMLYRHKCYTGTNIIPVQMLYQYKCYTGINVIAVQILYLYKCYTSTNVIPVQMLYLYKCYTSTNVIPVQMLYRYKCYTGTNVIPVQNHKLICFITYSYFWLANLNAKCSLLAHECAVMEDSCRIFNT